MNVRLFFIISVFVIFSLISVSTSSSRAQDICRDGLTSCDILTSDTCLAKHYACGGYETIVRTLYAESYAPTVVQKYFIGASLYGLYTRTRSKGLQCEYVRAAREYLDDYLTKKQLEFTSGGSFGSVGQMNQLYHATKMYEDLKKVTGCLESAYTRARIEAVAQAEAIATSKSFFLNAPDDMKSEFDTIRQALRGFVSKASDLETGMALRRIEIQSGNRHVGIIVEIFADIFGNVTVSGGDVAISTNTLDSLGQKSERYLTEVEQEEHEFTQALGGISPEAYAQIRAENIRNAQDMLKQSAFHIEMIGELLPTDKSKPFWTLQKAINAPGAEREAFEGLEKVKNGWKAYGEGSGECRLSTGHKQRWYCK